MELGCWENWIGTWFSRPHWPGWFLTSPSVLTLSAQKPRRNLTHVCMCLVGLDPLPHWVGHKSSLSRHPPAGRQRGCPQTQPHLVLSLLKALCYALWGRLGQRGTGNPDTVNLCPKLRWPTWTSGCDPQVPVFGLWSTLMALNPFTIPSQLDLWSYLLWVFAPVTMNATVRDYRKKIWLFPIVLGLGF